MQGQCNANANTMPPSKNEYVRDFFQNIFDVHLLAGKFKKQQPSTCNVENATCERFLMDTGKGNK